MNGEVAALTVFDDGSGSGPAVFAGGYFWTAGGVLVNRIAKWNGSHWSPLDSGMNFAVRALSVFDDGSGGGPALCAGGSFTTAGGLPAGRVAQWDGTSWSPLGGLNGDVLALTVFDDGSGGGPALYAGGDFRGGSKSCIAKWDGGTWTSLGSGVTGSVESVDALAVFDDGGGPALFAGGIFTAADGVPANSIAKWDGASWSPLGSGLTRGSSGVTHGHVSTLTVFDDGSGSGPALIVGGDFTLAGGLPANSIAKWDGTSWSPLGSGVQNYVWALDVFDDGSGPALYAGGLFWTAGHAQANHIAKWDGARWTPLGRGVGSSVGALTVFDDGGPGGPTLFTGGRFTKAGSVTASYIAEWSGAHWSALGSGLEDDVSALAEFDDGSGGGPALFAAGAFESAGGVSLNHIGRWDGGTWSPLGSGMDGEVAALMVFDDGNGGGPALYAGGDFASAGGVSAFNIARWNGTAWSPLGSGVNNDVAALAVFDDGSGGGPALYAGGGFLDAGGVPAAGIARWDGATWSPLGSGTVGPVRVLAVFDDGSGGGPELYVGGFFTSAGGMPANHVAKWDGTSWSPLGSGTSAAVLALEPFDDGGGGGLALWAGGIFSSAGGLPASYLAQWDGAGWSPLGSEVNGAVRALTVFDDGTGTGPALHAAGSFTAGGGAAANRAAKWDGATWSPLGSGLDDDVLVLTVFDDGGGGGPALFAGGIFTSALDSHDSYLAKWGCSDAGSGTTYCTAGTSASGCQATLSATGIPSATAPSGYTLAAASVEGGKVGQFILGTSGRQAIPWGNGTSYQCVTPPVVSCGGLTGAGTTGLCDGSFSQDLNALWTAKPQKNPGPGALAQAQLWYRDRWNTSDQTTSLSNAIEFVVAP